MRPGARVRASYENHKGPWSSKRIAVAKLACAGGTLAMRKTPRDPMILCIPIRFLCYHMSGHKLYFTNYVKPPLPVHRIPAPAALRGAQLHPMGPQNPPCCQHQRMDSTMPGWRSDQQSKTAILKTCQMTAFPFMGRITWLWLLRLLAALNTPH